MRISGRRVASLYLKMASDTATLFQLLASKNKTTFVQSVYQQFLQGKRLSDKQKSIIDDISLKAGLGPIFSSEATVSVMPTMSLDKSMDIDTEAINKMKTFLKLNSFWDSMEKPTWVEKYAKKREEVSWISNVPNWKNMYEISFFTTDVNVLKDENRNSFLIEKVKRVMGIIQELMSRTNIIDSLSLEKDFSSLQVLIDDLRFRDDNTSVYLKNTDKTDGLTNTVVGLLVKYNRML